MHVTFKSSTTLHSYIVLPYIHHFTFQIKKKLYIYMYMERERESSSNSTIVDDNHIHGLLKFLIVLVLCILSADLQLPSPAHGFSFDFYAFSCPSAEFIIRDTVRSATSADPTIPGKLLRLLFHDCFVQGCDASVLVEGNGTERSDPANASLGGFQVIDSAKRVLEMFCPATVSCADVLALAARDAVFMAGGPVVQIPTGRRDGMVSSILNVKPNIIDTSFTVDQMNRLFALKGLSMDDLVILSGAHTIGSAHCSVFSNRFQVNSEGNLTFIDSSLDRKYAAQLVRKCSSSTTVNNDPQTSLLFDNQYYKNLMAHKGLFHTDSALFGDPRTRTLVQRFATDPGSFFDSWNAAFLKLTSVGVKSTDVDGEIRISCSRVNG